MKDSSSRNARRLTLTTQINNLVVASFQQWSHYTKYIWHEYVMINLVHLDKHLTNASLFILHITFKMYLLRPMKGLSNYTDIVMLKTIL